MLHVEEGEVQPCGLQDVPDARRRELHHEVSDLELFRAGQVLEPHECLPC